ncbi:MAG: Endoribonuclease YbeY [Chlamydiia bacterium]|nr:Endoribonuclease YbeY [Chlamydiia bacterium]MCH9615803.1 Endoribonuclease YbeY [Chlamydiia bacterium]MCH9628794.1 Endoribonuclease YbeY [Chlamydiia bacterium]
MEKIRKSPDFQKPKLVNKLIHLLLDHYKVEFEEVSVNFVDIDTISKLHADFFDDPTPTDCITFPIEPGVGEIYVCPEIASSYTKEHGGNVNEEVTLYVVHGLLHLLDFDDIDEDDRKTMREEERICMSLLKEKGLILTPIEYGV